MPSYPTRQTYRVIFLASVGVWVSDPFQGKKCIAKRRQRPWKSTTHGIKGSSSSQLCHFLAGSLWGKTAPIWRLLHSYHFLYSWNPIPLGFLFFFFLLKRICMQRRYGLYSTTLFFKIMFISQKEANDGHASK